MLLACAAGPWLVGLGNQLQDVDPAQYAEVARHVAAGEGWLQLRDTHGPFVNKPPLAIWAQAVSIKILGATSVAARLPSLLFALLVLLGTGALGRTLLDSTRGAIATCLLAASVAIHQMVADPKVDLALTAMVTLALWAFVESASRPAMAIVCSMPAGESGMSLNPWITLREFHSVSPWRMTRSSCNG